MSAFTGGWSRQQAVVKYRGPRAGGRRSGASTYARAPEYGHQDKGRQAVAHRGSIVCCSSMPGTLP